MPRVPSGVLTFANAVSLFVRLMAGEGERPIAWLVHIAGLSRLLPAEEAAGHVLELHHSVSGGTKLLPERHVGRELFDAQGRPAVRSALFHIAIVAKRTLNQNFGTLVQKLGTLIQKFGTLEQKIDTFGQKVSTLVQRLVRWYEG